MKILALDPAATTGYCYGDAAPEQWGAWEITKPGDNHPGRRLERLRERLYAAHRAWQLERIAFEESSYGGSQSGRKGGIQWTTIVLHNKLRGVVECVASELGIPVVPVGITSVKAFACHGRAKKVEIINACELHFGIRTKSSDVADAIWIWAWAQRHPDGRPTKAQRVRRDRTRRKSEPKLFR